MQRGVGTIRHTQNHSFYALKPIPTQELMVHSDFTVRDYQHSFFVW